MKKLKKLLFYLQVFQLYLYQIFSSAIYMNYKTTNNYNNITKYPKAASKSIYKNDLMLSRWT
ncbi:hypothetical protein [Spiroplasma gladiatoris]|uniref:hypothetical protein n=1 Tax=Spiroplasma gladiatoris TaxID=2143 RepID=UPI0010676B9C|nr:hypothetical protein [Spiroplasma gladiatoris]